MAKTKKPLNLYTIVHYHRFGNCTYSFVSKKTLKRLANLKKLLKKVDPCSNFEDDRDDEYLEIHESGPLTELLEI